MAVYNVKETLDADGKSKVPCQWVIVQENGKPGQPPIADFGPDGGLAEATCEVINIMETGDDHATVADIRTYLTTVPGCNVL